MEKLYYCEKHGTPETASNYIDIYFSDKENNGSFCARCFGDNLDFFRKTFGALIKDKEDRFMCERHGLCVELDGEGHQSTVGSAAYKIINEAGDFDCFCSACITEDVSILIENVGVLKTIEVE